MSKMLVIRPESATVEGVLVKDNIQGPQKQALAILRHSAKLNRKGHSGPAVLPLHRRNLSAWLAQWGGAGGYLSLSAPKGIEEEIFHSLCEKLLVHLIGVRVRMKGMPNTWHCFKNELVQLSAEDRRILSDVVLKEVKALMRF